MSPFAPRVMDAKSASKATSVVKPTADGAAPNDFVFVEPSYQAKNETTAETKHEAKAEEASTPTVRAQEAALRFSDKTAAELLPVSMNAAQAQNAAPANTPAVNLAAEQKAQAGQQSVATGPKYTGEPISVNLKDVDLKDFFRLIHEISGLNVVLDPNVHGTLTVVLDDDGEGSVNVGIEHYVQSADFVNQTEEIFQVDVLQVHRDRLTCVLRPGGDALLSGLRFLLSRQIHSGSVDRGCVLRLGSIHADRE